MLDIKKFQKMSKDLQAGMETMKEELADQTAEGAAGGGAVRVVVNGNQELVAVKIKPEAVDPDDVDTNMLYVDHSACGRANEQVIQTLEEYGVMVSERPPDHFRVVVNRHHDRAVIEEAVGRIKKAMKYLVKGK